MEKIVFGEREAEEKKMSYLFSFPPISSNHYSKAEHTAMPLQNVAIGDFCVARFSEDHLWYRARVVLQNSSMYHGFSLQKISGFL